MRSVINYPCVIIGRRYSIKYIDLTAYFTDCGKHHNNSAYITSKHL